MNKIAKGNLGSRADIYMALKYEISYVLNN